MRWMLLVWSAVVVGCEGDPRPRETLTEEVGGTTTADTGAAGDVDVEWLDAQQATGLRLRIDVGYTDGTVTTELVGIVDPCGAFAAGRVRVDFHGAFDVVPLIGEVVTDPHAVVDGGLVVMCSGGPDLTVQLAVAADYVFAAPGGGMALAGDGGGWAASERYEVHMAPGQYSVTLSGDGPLGVEIR